MKNAHERSPWPAVAFLACVAFAFVWGSCMRWGLGATTDSVEYTYAALSLAKGDGLMILGKAGIPEAMDYFPPLYSTVLAAGPFLGFDIPTWAMMLNALCFALSVFAVGALVFFSTRNAHLAAASAGLFLTAAQIAEAHLNAWTEPLFMMLALGSLLMLVLSEEYNTVRWLYAAGILAGLSALARYAGGAVIISGVLFCGFLASGDRKSRVSKAVLFGLIAAALPLVVYGVRAMVIGSPSALHWGFYLPDAEKIRVFTGAWTKWFFPSKIPVAARLVLTLLLFFYVGRVFKHLIPWLKSQEAEKERRGLLVVGLFAGVYLLLSKVIALTATSEIRMDARMLLPLLAAVCVMIPILVVRANKAVPVKAKFSAGMIVLSFLLTIGLLRTIQLSVGHFREGYGYTGEEWQKNALAKELRSLADDITIFTDDPMAFYVITNRPAVKIPVRAERADFYSWDKAAREIALRKSFIVLFRGASEDVSPVWQEVLKKSGAVELFRDGKRVILGCRIGK